MSEPARILIVDDRPEGLVALSAILAQPDYVLFTAESGAKALAQVLQNDFAVILMDVQMPDMDGFETARIIKQRERSRNTPIIFLTANKSEQQVLAGYSVGAVDYLLKPIDPVILKSKVAVFVELYRKNRLIQSQTEGIREIERRDRLRLLAELEHEGRRRYQSLADAIPQIVFRANRNGSIEYFNQFWHLYSGMSLPESLESGWSNSIHIAELSEIQAKWLQARNDLVGFEMECRIKAKSGEYRWHLLKVIPEFDGASQILCWIGTATDIQDQKAVQQNLFWAKKAADAANETKSRFLANMSHEIRTPLGAILGFAELLIDEKSTLQEKNESIDAIRRNGEQLSKIIDEILDLSKVEAGKMKVELAEVAIIDLLNGVKALLMNSAATKGLALDFVLHGKIPTRILSSATRLQQILVNLIGNAIKFTKRGGVVVTVSFAGDENMSKGVLSVSIKDSGPGLARDEIEKLFQPFTQVDSAMTRNHGGTGLGLSLSRRLARVLGGDIVVRDSCKDVGSDFVFTTTAEVPAGSAMTSSLESESRHERHAVAHESGALKGLKVLLVEDLVDNQVLLTRFLTIAGAQVEIANNGLEGVEKAMSIQPDIVLMDIQMPVLDGFGAIAQLRRKDFKRPIVALTARGMIEEKNHCIEIGATDHLTKPVNRALLIERIHDLCAAEQTLP